MTENGLYVIYAPRTWTVLMSTPAITGPAAKT
jgi:hypothetical protein